MTAAQEYYHKTDDRTYALMFKSHPEQFKAELNKIHLIQVLTWRLIRYGFNQSEYSEMMRTIEEYESTYEKYELEHYEIQEQGQQLNLF